MEYTHQRNYWQILYILIERYLYIWKIFKVTSIGDPSKAIAVKYRVHLDVNAKLKKDKQ